MLHFNHYNISTCLCFLMVKNCLFLCFHSPILIEIKACSPSLHESFGEDIIGLYLPFSSSWDLRDPVRLCVCSSCNTFISLSQTYCISINTTVLITGDPMEHEILVLKRNEPLQLLYVGSSHMCSKSEISQMHPACCPWADGVSITYT